MINCTICSNCINKPIYHSNSNVSVTSNIELYNGNTIVYFCDKCGHLQTPEVNNIDEYYDKDYKILIDSEDEDQLYQIKDGKNIFRYDYQADTFLSLINIPEKARILDYGCAKGSTLKKIVQKKPDIQPFLFDISEMYVPFWEKFVSKENYSSYKIKDSWLNNFDIITAFFSLEHAKSPNDMVKQIWELLKDKGVFYFIIPNPINNTADSIVIDHVNHFTEPSIRYLLKSNGFMDIKIDSDIHINAFVVTATKTKENIVLQDEQALINELNNKFIEITNYWKNFSVRISEFEKETEQLNKVAIYGSGFYGAFITSCLGDQSRVSCYIDQSPFRQGKELFGKPIVAPKNISKEVDIIYVGLNPKIAKEEIEKIDTFKTKKYKYFFP